MPSAFDTLQPMSFAGIAFPVRSVKVRGGLRDKVFEYDHVPGGSPEKLGRKLYEIEVVAPFHVTIPGYDNLWPNTLQRLRETYENEETADLVIPTVGTIQAYSIDWDQEMNAETPSGEDATFKFREDQSTAFLVSALVQVDATSLEQQAQDFSIAVEDSGEKNSLFDSIKSIANSIASIKDQGELFQSQVEAKCLALADACQKADATVRFLNDPVHHAVVDSIHVLWESATKLHRDVQQKRIPIIDYTVPQLMGVGAISKALYGTSAKGGDIMRLNAIVDAFAIPANTKLRVYEAT